MKSHDHVRRMSGLILLACVATLPACVQPRVQQAEAGDVVTAEQVSELTNQVHSLRRYTSHMEQTYAAQEAEIESLRRYAAQMDDTYASQEAEILRLRQQVASLSSPSQTE